MVRISDIIETFIKDMIGKEQDGRILIQRNELANKFSCAPSQITYVLSSRFTYAKGYVIESKRGGGGFIVIKKVNYDNNQDRLNIINEAIGQSITYNNALSIIKELRENGFLSEKEEAIINISLNDRTLSSSEYKNILRADILKGILTVILS